jgi:mono/diheme cytochrome c family protein
MRRTLTLLLGLSSALFLLFNSCQHKPDDYIPDTDTTPCDTSNITYPGTVYPILDQNCISCHSGAAPEGGLDFTDYNRVAFVAENGALIGAIKHLDGYLAMPQKALMLDNCQIRQIEIWIRDTTFTPPPDTTNSHPCDPDTIYFSMDVLPILSTRCALPAGSGTGCHDVVAQEGVRLDSYAATMASDVITPGNPNESHLWKHINETDPEDIMPPPPNAPLDPAQKEIIRKWIAQGALDLYCDEGCDTSNVTFSGTIWPEIIQNNCFGCHNGPNASGGIHLETHGQVASAALIPAGQPGSLWGAVNWADGNSKMPKNQPKLSDCKISQLKKWIDAGALDN